MGVAHVGGFQLLPRRYGRDDVSARLGSVEAAMHGGIRDETVVRASGQRAPTATAVNATAARAGGGAAAAFHPVSGGRKEHLGAGRKRV